MRKVLTEKAILIGAGILIILAFLFSSYTAYRTLTLSPGEEVVTSGGITVAKPTNNITDATLRPDGYLVVKFEDGTEKEVGYIVGQRGNTGAAGQSIPPTDAQIALAVTDYCTTDNRCDPKSPSPEQVATAVANYCAGRDNCSGPKGDTGSTGTPGADGQNATAEQIMAAVTSYCSDGRCTGPKGDQGIPGIDGKDPFMSCVIREVNGIDRQYVAWKYVTEPDASYRNLYILPVWAQGENCVDLTA